MHFQLVKTRPLSGLRRNSSGTFPSVPDRAISACSRALTAVSAFRIATGASPEVRGCSGRSSGPAWPGRRGLDRSTSVPSAPLGQRAPARCGPACQRGACGPLPAWKMRWTVFLLKPGRPRHCAIAEGRLGLDHRPDQLGKAGIDLRCGPGCFVMHRPSRHAEPGAEPAQRHLDLVRRMALLKRPDQSPSSRSMSACSLFRASSSSMTPPPASCRSFSCFTYHSRMSSGLARKEFSMPRSASVTHPSTSEGDKSKRSSIFNERLKRN